MNDVICPYVLIKKSEYGFVILAIYIDDMNFTNALKYLQKATDYLNREFKLKYLRTNRYCLRL